MLGVREDLFQKEYKVIFSQRSHQELRFDTKYVYKYRRTPYDLRFINIFNGEDLPILKTRKRKQRNTTAGTSECDCYI